LNQWLRLKVVFVNYQSQPFKEIVLGAIPKVCIWSQSMFRSNRYNNCCCSHASLVLSKSLHIGELFFFLVIWHHKKLLYLFYILTLQNIQYQWFYFFTYSFKYYFFIIIFFIFSFTSHFICLSFSLLSEILKNNKQTQNPSHQLPPPLSIGYHYHNPNPPNLQHNHLKNQPKSHIKTTKIHQTHKFNNPPPPQTHLNNHHPQLWFKNKK